MDQPAIEKDKKTIKQKIIGGLLWVPRKIWDVVLTIYYRTHYKLVHQLRIKEFIFIDYRVLTVLSLVILILYLSLYVKPIYLAIPSLGTELYIAENTLRTVSIFVGIVFSFIVLSFNVFYKYFGRLTFIKFFTSRHIKFIFTLFIGDMVLLLYTCGYLKEGAQRNSYGDGLFASSLVVSFVLVIAIIPTLILLLRSSQNRNNITELISEFNADWSLRYHVNVLWKKGDKNRHYQRDPITLLIEIGTAAIKESDRTSLLAIKEGCIAHLNKMLADYKEKPELHPNAFYDKLDDLTRALFPVAIKERNETAALLIVNMCLDIEVFYVKNFKDFNVYESADHHYDGIRFMVVMAQFLAKSLQFNEDAVSQRIIEVLREWWDDTVIKTYLPAIGYDYPKKERFPTDKTTFFLSSTYSQVENTFDLVYTYKKLFLYKEISKFFSVTNLSIIDSKNTRNTQVYLLQLNGHSSLSAFEKFTPKVEVDIAWEMYPFGIASTYEIDGIRSHVPFKYEMMAFDFLFRTNKLNAYVINNIKAIAYHAMGHFKEREDYKDVLKSVIEKFDYLRSLVPEATTDQQKEIYLLLERYLRYIQEWMPEYKITDQEILTLTTEALGRFTFKQQFTSELEGKGYLIRDIR